jgi:hypothetical protein
MSVDVFDQKKKHWLSGIVKSVEKISKYSVLLTFKK